MATSSTQNDKSALTQRVAALSPAQRLALQQRLNQLQSSAVPPTASSPSSPQRLVAYVVTPQQSDEVITKLQTILQQKLPAHMVPSAIVAVDALPRTPNGKVNVKALPVPSRSPAVLSSKPLPRSTVEATLVHIWQEVLGLEEIGLSDNFFDLGGHSLLAIQVVSKIQDAFSTDLPLAALFQAQTIQDLADLITSSHQSIAPSSVVALHPVGSQKPLFFINSTGQARTLAPYLNPEVPIYSLNIFGLRPLLNEAATPVALPELAQHLLKDLRIIQPEGPYRLIGYCQDGPLTLELARHLRQQGETNSSIFLIDSLFQAYAPTWPHRLRSVLEFGWPYFTERMRGIWHRQQKKFRRAMPLKIEALTTDERLQLLEKKEEERAFYAQYFQSAIAYKPQMNDQKVIFLLSSEFRSVNRSLLREKISTTNLNVQIVKGLHGSLLREPYVRNLADVLEQNLTWT